MPTPSRTRRPRPTGPNPVTLATLPPETRAAFEELQREGAKLGVTLTLTCDRFVFSGKSGRHSISARSGDTDAERLRGHANGFFGWYRARDRKAARTQAEQLSLLTGAVA